MTLTKVLKTWGGLAGMALAAYFLVGCTLPEPEWADPTWPGPATQSHQAAPAPAAVHSPEDESDRLRAGDLIRIEFSGVTILIPAHDEQIKADGSITLDKLGKVTAAGKTPGQLQEELNLAYKKYYRTLTVVVRAMDRFYTVGGEVKLPNRYIHLGNVTVVAAIKSAGDFTDFADKKKVGLIRANGTVETINVEAAITNPTLDLPVHPGDIIHVKRRWL